MSKLIILFFLEIVKGHSQPGCVPLSKKIVSFYIILYIDISTLTLVQYYSILFYMIRYFTIIMYETILL